MRRFALIPILILALVAATVPALAAPATETKITEPDGAPFFGIPVQIEGDLLIASAASSNARRGAVFVYRRSGDTWASEAKLEPSGIAPGDQFGFHVDRDGQTIVAGAPGRFDASGTAYVYRRSGDTWALEQTLVSSTPGIFGGRVAVDGDTLAVADIFDTTAGFLGGDVHIYRRSGDTWTLEQTVIGSGTGPNGRFGDGGIVLREDLMIVGAPQDDSVADNAGAVYVFRRSGDTWSEDAKLSSADPDPGDLFGITVDMSGGTIVAGAIGDDEAASQAGAAYVFSRGRGGWNEAQKLAIQGASPNTFFGRVAISGGTIAVGSSSYSGHGAVFVYHRGKGGWSENEVIVASDIAPSDQFGRSVSVSGGTIAVSSHLNDEVSGNGGAIYVYRR